MKERIILHIDVNKQTFMCYVCKTGGDVFTFVEKYKKISFVEAVKEVAKITNFNMEAELLRYINYFYKHDIIYPVLSKNIGTELNVKNDWDTIPFYDTLIDYENYLEFYEKIKLVTNNEELKRK